MIDKVCLGNGLSDTPVIDRFGIGKDPVYAFLSKVGIGQLSHDVLEVDPALVVEHQSCNSLAQGCVEICVRPTNPKPGTGRRAEFINDCSGGHGHAIASIVFSGVS